MNEFLIRFASAEDALSQMQQVESAIRSNGEELVKIRNDFRAAYDGKTRILQNLHGQINKISNLGDVMKNFESSLESILGMYNAVEQKLAQMEDRAKAVSRGTGYSSHAEHATDTDETMDRIYEAGKKDERRGLIAGATMIGAATLGSAMFDADGTGGNNDPAHAQGVDKQIPEEGAEEHTGNSEKGEMPVATDLEELEPGLEQMSLITDMNLPKDASWEDFLRMLPEEVVDDLPRIALEYLRELYDLLKVFPMPFGPVFFPGLMNIINCGIWTTLYTLITWYYFQQGASENKVTESADSRSESEDLESETGDLGIESEDSQIEFADPEKTASNKTGEDVSSSPKEEKTDAASASARDGSNTESPKTSAQNAEDKAAGRGSSGSGVHSGVSGGGSPYTGEPVSDVPVTDDLTKDYLSGLVKDSETSIDKASDWALGTMNDWGQKAAGQLAGGSTGEAVSADISSTENRSGSGVIGRTARSVVCAALINAGIEMVIQGAGAVSSIFGGDEKNLFPDMETNNLP